MDCHLKGLRRHRDRRGPQLEVERKVVKRRKQVWSGKIPKLIQAGISRSVSEELMSQMILVADLKFKANSSKRKRKR